MQVATYLIVRRSESSPDVTVIEDRHLEREVFLQVLDDHNQEGELNS